ncbi:PREDICTED: macrophage mannose receptor 1-like [Crocodylus porosus]|uniref:macrophage mannose receptor 1-like n=1 Tax=Crocodylus porosus TaxID=8502 RepID=UPI00093AF6A0|nr:PREDICTED: macrophage mannose receptor 1-like [Crocodylus porosus]
MALKYILSFGRKGERNEISVMTLFTFLAFLSLFGGALQLLDNGIFLIYNEYHKHCIQVYSSRSVRTASCHKDNEFQKFRWVSEHQLMSIAFSMCLGVTSKEDKVAITLYPCNKTSELQLWECRNEGLFGLRGEDLFFNSDDIEEENIMLYNGSNIKSKWKIYGTTEDLCSRSYEDKNTVRFWTTDPSTGTYYQINSQSALTWHQARKSCQQQNAELLSVTEIHEQTYLRGLTEGIDSSLWTGLNRLDLKSGWQWTGGNPFRYLNWAPGNPSSDAGKNCAALNPGKNFQWENRDCGEKIGYICKRGDADLANITIPSGDFESVHCPDGWRSYAGHCYMIYREPKVWEEALTSCRKNDGNLVSIHNMEEHSFIVSQLGYKPTEELWIGLNDNKVQMYFEWSDGTPVTYTKWLHGEPTHENDRQEDCGIMKGQDGYWADHVCKKKTGYVCKRKPLVQVPEEKESADAGCQKGWKRYGTFCYSIGNVSETFLEANKACQRNNGYIATVENRYEQAFLISLVGLTSEKYFWIGLFDAEEQGIFKWANGEEVVFTHWNSGMPGRESGCAAMRTGPAAGLWDVLPCEIVEKFICKQRAADATYPPVQTTAPAPVCPEGWVSTVHSNSCFKVFLRDYEQQKTWLKARDFCREMGGDLASIHSKEEHIVINSALRDINTFGNTYLWIGIFFLEGLAWSDGSPVTYTGWFESSSIQDESKYCGTINEQYNKWHKVDCRRYENWICQIKKGPFKPEPTDKPAYKTIEDSWIIHEDKQYFISNDYSSMEKSQEFCKKNFAELAVIESESEREFLWKNSDQHEPRWYYIGLTVSLDKRFSWIDGSLVNYVAWAPDEPNFQNNDENCVVMDSYRGFWSDVNCGALNFFICERHNSSIKSTYTPLFKPGGCPETWLLFNNKCFKIFGSNKTEELTWHDARTACVTLGGNLATIPNKQLQAFLFYHLKEVMTDVWIGLHDMHLEMAFLWTDGSSISYANWALGAPSNKNFYNEHDNSEKNCVIMALGNGKWRDKDCTEAKGYICQINSDPKLLLSSTTVPASDFTHFGGSSYSIIQSKMTWEEARKNCKNKSSELASILDAYSQSFLWLQILKYGEPVWIGLNSEVMSTYYQWTDNWLIKYSQWARGQPKTKRACVYVDINGYWNTASCNKNFSSVCKRSDVVAPSGFEESAEHCPESESLRSWIAYRGHCYYIETSAERSWTQASLECIKLGATLASVEDSAESDFLTYRILTSQKLQANYWFQHYENIYGNFFLSVFKHNIYLPLRLLLSVLSVNTDGFYSLGHYSERFDFWTHLLWSGTKIKGFWIGIYRNMDGQWLWLDNTAVDFVNWNAEQPNEGGHCVEISGLYGFWNKLECSYEQGFVCEKSNTIEIEKTVKISREREEKKDEEPSASGSLAIWILGVLAILSLAGAGLMASFLYKKKMQNQEERSGEGNEIQLNSTDTAA